MLYSLKVRVVSEKKKKGIIIRSAKISPKSFPQSLIRFSVVKPEKVT